MYVGTNPTNIYLDGSASFNETNYQLEIMQVGGWGCTTPVAGTSVYDTTVYNSLDSWGATPRGPGIMDLKTLYSFAPNKIYRVRVRVWRDCAPNVWDEDVRYVVTAAYGAVFLECLPPGGGGIGGRYAQTGSSEPTIGTFDAYPNPVEGGTRLRFSLSVPTAVGLRIFNAQGQLMTEPLPTKVVR